MKERPLPYRYSGRGSVRFWNAINAIEDPKEHRRLYGIGCRLQSLEHEVLKVLRLRTNKEGERKQT